MPRIPENLRERALGMLGAGCTTAEVAARVGASVQSIRSLRRRFADREYKGLAAERLTARNVSSPRPLYLEPAPARSLSNSDSYSCCYPRYSQQPYFRPDCKESFSRERFAWTSSVRRFGFDPPPSQ